MSGMMSTLLENIDHVREVVYVAIYFRDHLNVKERNKLVPEHIEAVCTEVIKAQVKADTCI